MNSLMSDDDGLLPTTNTAENYFNTRADIPLDTGEALVEAILTLAISNSSQEKLSRKKDDDQDSENSYTKQEADIVLEPQQNGLDELENTQHMLPSNVMEAESISSWSSHRKHFFVLSSAGKPIFSRYGNESEITELMGVFQTIVSFFEHDTSDGDSLGDVIQSFTAGNHLFVFKIMGPIYLVGVSATGESEFELEKQLGYIHDQILSITTLAQLTRIFEKRSNYDLRQLLTGTDAFLHKSISNFRRFLAYTLDSTPTIYIGTKLRSRMNKILGTSAITESTASVPPSHIVYTLLMTPTTLLSSWKATNTQPLDPKDTIILMNLLQSNTASFKSGIEAWTPLCLPHFSSSAFLNAYVSCIFSRESGAGCDSSSVGEGSVNGLGNHQYKIHHSIDRPSSQAEDVYLVCLSKNREGFFDISEYKHEVVKKMEAKACFEQIDTCLLDSPYRITLLGTQQLTSRILHFACRAKKSMQYTECKPEPPYTSHKDYERLVLLYQLLLSKLYPPKASCKPAKLVFVKGSHEAVIAMSTNSYDIMAAFHPLIPKREAEECVMALYRWIKKNDVSFFW
ncbi:trafficking protein Mon1-domain-containing protein [Obelidium mucronatum]|nr:trafficking protein Mon1-domain-containing protein [Obelidium mucronatum]